MLRSNLINMETTAKITAVIAAYNEARNIASLLGVLQYVDVLSEIIVVDDGCQDATAKKVQDAAGLDRRIRLIQHPQNLGKGQAILTGRDATTAPILLLLDADLKELTPEQVVSLMEPVLYRNIDMTLGLFKGGQFLTDFSHWGTPWLTGQRCLRSNILDHIDTNAASGYGFETALTLAAYRNDWQTEIVWLRGVWHPPSEFHRGLLYGIRQRSRMYFQIMRAWHLAGGWSIFWRKTKKRIILFFTLVMLALFILQGSSFMDQPTSSIVKEFDSLPELSLEKIHRILIIAPHPDDETLASGGVIQQAEAKDLQVKVVVVTNGDGQGFAPYVLSKKVDAEPQDYVVLGERRQAESVAALQSLGVQTNDMVFLGYPDRGIGPMWLADWNTECPYTARYTRVKENPYPDTFHPRGVYCGSNLLADLQTIINNYRPDLVILSHPADQHPDHGAVGNFARLAIAQIHVSDSSYMPEIWGYIVHYGRFPQPRGKHINQVLVPPAHFMHVNNNWGRIDLNPSQVSRKYSAIEDYPTQNLLLGQFLTSFARRNELYEALPMQVVPFISVASLPVFLNTGNESSDLELASLNNEEFSVKGSLLMGWQAARLNDKMWLDLQVQRDIFPVLRCVVYLKLPDGQTKEIDLKPIGSVFATREFIAQLDLSALGNPSVLAFAAQIKQGGMLIVKTGWHILVLE